MELSILVDWFEANTDKILDDVALEPWEYITDGKTFVSSHLETLKTYGGRPRYKIYYERLFKYWQLCQNPPEDIAVLRARTIRPFCNYPRNGY